LDKGDEFTCAIIKLKNFEKIIILKRKLHKFGHTMFAETFNNLRIEKKLLKIANKINLHGSINIQFRIQNNNIKIFDINPRLSSTIKMRDLIGFKDCLWWINDKLGLKNKDKIKIDKDKLLIKYFDENIISTTKTKKLKFLLKVPRNKDIHFLFNLYNQNVLEKKFFSLKKVSFKEHKTWFNNKIKGKMFYISLIDNKKLGYVRFDKIDEKNLSVSIAIKKEFQRKGYGKKMLSKILNKKELKKYNIWAYTLSKNITSKKFFLNLGFKSFKDNQFVKQSKIS
jgi:RimJ/RimL family protein N-acetyltransferase